MSGVLIRAYEGEVITVPVCGNTTFRIRTDGKDPRVYYGNGSCTNCTNVTLAPRDTMQR